MLAPAQTGVAATHLDFKGIASYGYSPTTYVEVGNFK